jgi:uncharacterized protein (PEP-CTERM system associated)
VSASETYNHYSGSGAPSDGTSTALTGSVNFDGEGARVKLRGTVSATEVLYTGQGASNSFAPGASVFGSVEAIEKFFFVDATVNVTQTYASPFGPQPSGLAIPTANRYTAETYSVSPYIQGVLGSAVAYKVRDDNIWTSSQTYGDSSVKPPATYWNNFDAQLNSVTGGPNGWTAQYTRQFYDSGASTGNYTLQLARFIDSFRIDPQLDVSARLGYEHDSFPAESAIGNTTQGTFYGAGAHWRPTERTDVNGWWEHHYYGSSYSWTISHRLPNVALSANFSRGLSSYPQLALLIPAGVPVAQFLDAAFTTRIPDPVARAQAVQQFLAQSGLPPTLISPLNVYATTVTLQNIATASAVWIGALNSVTFTVYRSESESVINQTTLPEPFVFGANSIQVGAGVSYAHRVSALTNFNASLNYSTARPTGQESDLNVQTHNYNATTGLTTSFSPKTSGSVGVSYFIFDTAGSIGRQSTLSLFASISHTF